MFYKVDSLLKVTIWYISFLILKFRLLVYDKKEERKGEKYNETGYYYLFSRKHLNELPNTL